MREVNVMKKRIIIAVVIILFIIAGYLLYWKYPSGRDNGKYVEEPEPVTGLSRLLIVTMADGNIHKVSYGGYLTIDGDSYMDHPGGYSEEGGILGTGEKSVPEY